MKVFHVLLFTIVFSAFGCLQQQYNIPKSTNNEEGKIQEKSPVNFRQEEGSTIINQTYSTSLEQTTDGLYLFKRYYPTTNVVTHWESYADKSMKILHGKYIRRYDNGNLWYEGEYQNNKASGKWKYYNVAAKHSESEGNYNADVKVGTWVSYYNNTQKQAEYIYNDAGQLDGTYTIWDESGEVTSVSIYADGKKLKSRDSNLNKPTLQMERMPIFGEYCGYMQDYRAAKQCSDKAVLAFIYENMDYPDFARINGIEGSATVSFIIDKIGNITEIEVLNGVCDEMKKECIRLIESFPNWSPALRNGKPVSVQLRLPIEFELK
jgi:TonB family protein